MRPPWPPEPEPEKEHHWRCWFVIPQAALEAGLPLRQLGSDQRLPNKQILQSHHACHDWLRRARPTRDPPDPNATNQTRSPQESASAWTRRGTWDAFGPVLASSERCIAALNCLFQPQTWLFVVVVIHERAVQEYWSSDQRLLRPVQPMIQNQYFQPPRASCCWGHSVQRDRRT